MAKAVETQSAPTRDRTVVVVIFFSADSYCVFNSGVVFQVRNLQNRDGVKLGWQQVLNINCRKTEINPFPS